MPTQRFSILPVIILAILITLPETLFATHARGTDLSYQCTSPNTYQFTLNFYRDCAGVTVGNTMTLQYSSANCGLNGNIPLTLVGTATEVSPFCPAQLSNSTCNGGTQPGVEQYTFQGSFVFPAACNDWVISYDHCCRNNAITNLQAPGGQSMFVTALLNNASGLCNSSPSFTSLPTPYICAGQRYCYNHGAVDPDGDSLVYSLVNAMDGPAPGSNIAYVAPNSPTYPITDTRGYIDFDSATGSMCVIPNGPQVNVVTVKVEEYRNGVLIGFTHRDMQVVVQNCANAQPQDASGGISNLGAGPVQIDSNSIQVCPGVPISFDVTYSDANVGDNITVTDNVGTAIPGASTTVFGNNPAIFNFSWTPTPADVGFHQFTVTIQDNGCPILGSQIFAFDIQVLDGTDAVPDTAAYCPAGGPVQLGVSGGTSFTWSTISGGPANLSCTNCANPTAAPATTVVLDVLSDLSAICKNRDTVVVNVVPDITVDAGRDTTICKNGAALLPGTVTPGSQSPFTFSWSPAATVANPTNDTTTASPTTTTSYILDVTSAAGCNVEDTVVVSVFGVAPIVSIAPADTICLGDSAFLDASLYYDCGITTTPCSSPTVDDTIGTGITSSEIIGPFDIDPGTNSTQRIQYIFGPAELAAQGFTGGRINSISVDLAAFGGSVNNIEIWMGCTGLNQWATPTDTFITTMVQVLGPTTINPVAGWNTIPFTSGFNWSGQNNLVVEFRRCASTLGNPSFVRYTTLGAPNAIRCLVETQTAGACGSATGSSFTTRPNIIFNHCEAIPFVTTYNWFPPVGLNSTTVPDVMASPPSTTTYSLTVFDGSCVGTGFVDVEVAPLWTLDAGNDTTICRNSGYNIYSSSSGAGGPFTYSWSPSAGLSDTTVLSPFLDPSTSTQYILNGRSAAGCELADTVGIFVSGVAPDVDAGLNDTICLGDTSNLLASISFPCGVATNPCSGPQANDTVGTGTTTNNLAHPFFKDAFAFYGLRRQYIFTAAELNAMGFNGGRIDALGMEMDMAGEQIDNWTIKMGCTSQDDLSSGNFIPGLTTVRNPTNTTPAAGWNNFAFTSPYNWDGVSNLVVEFCSPTTNSILAGVPASTYFTCGSVQRALYVNGVFVDGCVQATGTPSVCRPNMYFTHCEANPAGLSYSWNPGTNLSSTTVADPNANPPTTTLYSVAVDDGGGCVGVDQVTVQIDNSVTVNATADTTSFCTNDTILLNASVTGTGQVLPLPSCGVNGTACTTSSLSRTVGTGTSTNAAIGPFYGLLNDHRIQYLITAAELNAAGISSGTITILGWNVITKNSTGPYDNFTISMACTGASALTPGVWEGGLTTVFGPQQVVSNTGVNQFALSGPFDWDGSSNIVIQVCYNNPDGALIGSDEVAYTSGIGFNATQSESSNTNGADGCALDPPTVIGTTRPNIEFTFCTPTPQPFTYSWTPSAPLDNPTLQSPTSTPSGVGLTYTVTVSGGRCPAVDSVTTITCALDVRILDFYGEKVGGSVQLNWLTQNEKNINRYDVERSIDGTSFNKVVGSQASLGDYQGQRTYQVTDLKPVFGLNHYRLKIIDQNGDIAYSKVLSFYFEPASGLMGIYPNPAGQNDIVKLDFLSETDGSVSVSLIDIIGRELKSQDYEVQKGRNELDLSLSEVSAGTYFVRVKAGNQLFTGKLVIRR